MKKLILFIAIPLLFVACKGNENKSDATATDSSSTAAPVDTSAATSATQYTCPMHPEVISDKPGSCPKCGMDLELKENSEKSDAKGDVKNDKAMDHKGCKGCMHKH